MSHHLLVDGLKKLLMCTRRRPRQHASPATYSSTSEESDNLAGSPDSTQCQPQFSAVAAEAGCRGERPWARSPESTRCRAPRLGRRDSKVAELEQGIPAPVSESACTLCSGSMDAEEREAMIAALNTGDWQVSCYATDCAGALSEKRLFRESLDCQAEICQLPEIGERCSHVRESADAYTLKQAHGLVTCDQQRLHPSLQKKKRKVVNNALLNLQQQLSAEMCEVNLHQSNSFSENINNTVHVSTNLSNMMLHRPSSCHASEQNACMRSPLQVLMPSDESEPRTTCASVTASLAPSYEPLSTSIWLDGDDNRSTAAGDGSTGCPQHRGTGRQATWGHAERAFLSLRIEDKLLLPPYNTKLCPADLPSTDRFGSLSIDRCSRLSQCLLDGSGGTLLKQYLSKRDVDAARLELHSRRCGRISSQMVEKICTLPQSSAAAPINASCLQTLAAANLTTRNSRKAQISAKWMPAETTDERDA